MSEGRERPPGAGARAPAGMTRRTLLQRAASLGVGAATLGALDVLARTPPRAQAKAKTALPEVQFQIEKFIPRAVKLEGVKVLMPPVYTTFATIALTRTPTQADQATLASALAAVEASYPFSPSGVFATVAYGVPYLERLPGGLDGALVAAHMPRLASEPQSYAFAEAVPGPTDVSPANPEVTKQRFQIPVQIESNDMLVTLRSDSTQAIDEALAWLAGESSTLAGANVGGSGLGELLSVTSRRLTFTQIGLPRRLAEEHALPYAQTINPSSPMWMGFSSQQVGTSGPPAITTFLGDASARLTTARKGDYFDHGSVQHLSHVIQDLEQFYEAPGETYERRVAEMFSADPVPRPGNADQFADGGGPAFIPSAFANPQQAEREAEGGDTFDGQPHLAHTTALQRTSRAPDRTPMHIRADGPGFDSLDVPHGSPQPKLHFSIFVPSAAFFATLRRSQASLDLAQRYGVSGSNLGLERFLTATRRQNFIVPPRRNRAFPLVELA
ncbi:MAG TPA: hypothetical protein VKV16_07295 [Solirubrobacteraceae bacterium]|nr:hypothetical protein [Solirubrobacteraceae bacterium]